VIYPDQPGYVAAIAYSPNGNRLAVQLRRPGKYPDLGRERSQGLRERDIGRGVIDSLEFNPDGQGLYATLRTTNFMLLDAATLEQRRLSSATHNGSAPWRRIRLDTRWFSAAGDLYGQVGAAEMFAWDATSRSIAFKFPSRSELALFPRFSRSGRYLRALSAAPGLVEVWDANDWTKWAEFNSHHGLVSTARSRRMNNFWPRVARTGLSGSGTGASLRRWPRWGRHIGAVEQVPILW